MALNLGNQDLKIVLDLQVKNQQAIQGLQKDIVALNGSTTKLVAGFSKVGPAAIAAFAALATRQIIQYSKSLIDMGDELFKASQKSGIAVEQLAAMKTSAELAGVSFGGLQVGLKKLSTAIVEGAAGNKKMIETFRLVGISARELKTINLDEAMKRIADAFAGAADGPEKMAIAVKLLGRNAGDFIPFLNGGAEAVDRFSVAIDEDFARSAERFNDQLKLMKNSLGSSGLGAIAPALEPISNVLQFITFNIDKLITGFRQMAILAKGIALVTTTSDWSKKGAFMSQALLDAEKVNEEFRKRNIDLQKKTQTVGLPGAVKLGGSLGVSSEDGAKEAEKRRRELEKETDALADWVSKHKEANQQRALELDRVRYTAVEYQTLTATRKFDADAARESSKFTDTRLAEFKKENEAIRGQIVALIELEEAQRRSHGHGALQAIHEYTEAATNSAALMKSAMLGTFRQMEDALTNFVKTGKLDFKSLVDFMIDEMIRMSLKQAIISPILGALGGFFGGLAGGAKTPGVNSSSSGFNAGLGNDYSFRASVGSAAPMVRAAGGAGGVMVGSIQVNMTGESSVESSQEKGKAVGKLMVAAIQSEIIKQRRPGGLLYG